MTFLKALLNLIAGGCALPAATVEGTLCATHDHAAAAADTHGVCILVAQLRTLVVSREDPASSLNQLIRAPVPLKGSLKFNRVSKGVQRGGLKSVHIGPPY